MTVMVAVKLIVGVNRGEMNRENKRLQEDIDAYMVLLLLQ